MKQQNNRIADDDDKSHSARGKIQPAVLSVFSVLNYVWCGECSSFRFLNILTVCVRVLVDVCYCCCLLPADG